MESKIPWLLVAVMSIFVGCATITNVTLKHNMLVINDELESHRNRLMGTLSALKLAEVRISDDLRTVWIPCECKECEGDGKVDGQRCEFCDNGVFTDDIKGQKIKCPVCRGTGKRIGGCPSCGGGGKLWLEKRVKAGE